MKILRQDTARTQKNLLTAASEIFAEKGFRDSTIAEISKRARTNVAAINYHFGDKETLYREAWRHSFRESIKNYPPDGGVDTNATPENRLVGQVTALLRRITDNGEHRVLNRSPGTCKADRIIRRSYARRNLKPLQQKNGVPGSRDSRPI